MAQGRSTKIIEMIKWIRTSRLSIKNSVSLRGDAEQEKYIEDEPSYRGGLGHA